MTPEVRVFSIIGSWPVDVELDAEQLDPHHEQRPAAAGVRPRLLGT
jgi:hypothetical protein